MCTVLELISKLNGRDPGDVELRQEVKRSCEECNIAPEADLDELCKNNRDLFDKVSGAIIRILKKLGGIHQKDT